MTTEIVMGQRLHELMILWNEGVKDEMRGYLKKGKVIYLLRKNKLWIKDCAGIPSFKYYVKHQLGISPAQAYLLEQIFRMVGEIIEHQQIDIDITAVRLLLPYLKDKSEDEKAEILQTNKGLPLEAVKNNVLDLLGQGNRATDVCEHDGDYELYRRCANCGKFYRAVD